MALRGAAGSRGWRPSSVPETAPVAADHSSTSARDVRLERPRTRRTVVGISPDPLEKLHEFAAKDGLPFALASDEDHAVAEAYGAWGEKKNYGKTYEGLIRSTFVVSPNGALAQIQHNVKATGHVARLRRELGLD